MDPVSKKPPDSVSKNPMAITKVSSFHVEDDATPSSDGSPSFTMEENDAAVPGTWNPGTNYADTRYQLPRIDNVGTKLLAPISQGRAIDPELLSEVAHRSIWARLEHRAGVAFQLFRVNLTGRGGRLPSFPTTLAVIRDVYLTAVRSQDRAKLDCGGSPISSPICPKTASTR